jgi:hypothetical protein
MIRIIEVFARISSNKAAASGKKVIINSTSETTQIIPLTLLDPDYTNSTRQVRTKNQQTGSELQCTIHTKNIGLSHGSTQRQI